MDDGLRQACARAADRIADRSHWATGQYARDADGKGVEAVDPRACRWCMVGAIARELEIGPGPDFIQMERELEAALGAEGHYLNDAGSHKDAVHLLRQLADARERRRKILVQPAAGGYSRPAVVTGRTLTGKLKAEDRYGNRFKVEMRSGGGAN